MAKEKKQVISIAYELHLESGQKVDEASKESPFSFITGEGSVLDALEKKLVGLEKGAAFKISLSSKEGYGDYEAELVADVPRSAFEGAKEGTLSIGASLPMLDQEGNTIFGVVVEVHDETINMDFNHPLAGQKLVFSGEIIESRPALRSEMETGKIDDNG